MTVIDFMRNMSWLVRWVVAFIFAGIADYVWYLIFGNSYFYPKLTYGNLKISLGALAVLMILFFIFMAWANGEKRARWIREGRIRVGFKILKRLKKQRVIGSLLSNWLGYRLRGPPDELHPLLKELRIELYVLMNYLLRHEIYKTKRLAFADTIEKVLKKEGPMQSVELDEEELRKSMIRDVEGGKVEPVVSNGRIVDWVLGKNETTKKHANTWGIARKDIVIYKLMKELKEILELNLAGETPEIIKSDKYVENKMGSIVDVNVTQLDDAYDRYKATISRIKVLNYIKATRLYFQDMYNMYGQYVRGYGFAKKGAIPKIYEVETDDNKVTRDIKWETARAIKNGSPAEYEEGTAECLVEVNLFGYAVSDINAIQTERKNPEVNGKFRVRRFKKEDLTLFHLDTRGKFSQILTFSESDWDFNVQDMQKGVYHPYSRTTEDYAAIMEKKGRLDFENARFSSLLKENQTAFDREALKQPDKFVYWGRKHYYDESVDSPRFNPANPYPTVSLEGLWNFISTVAKQHSKEAEQIRKYLNDYFRMQSEFLEQTAGETVAK
ncbi:MAG: hypothetical protein AABX33_05220 [Nanoarchaeota archaeon]